MSGIALIAAVLVTIILNVIPSTLPLELAGQAHLLYVLLSLFAGVVTYQAFRQ